MEVLWSMPTRNKGRRESMGNIYLQEIEELLDSALNELSPALFEKLKEDVKQLIANYD